ncbi:MAG: type 3 dihydrofolate reductase [Legionellales bacterium]|nr:type 3 dihydrofolate reductase [Legionellales bacterium]
MTISIIAAMAKNRVIGFENKMPWHLPAELQYFKKVTMGKPIIMGRKTFESIGKPLPGRDNIIITRQVDYQFNGTMVAHSLETALRRVQHHPEVMIIGGANIYKQAIHLANKMYLTVIDASFQGDAFFPKWDAKQWHITAQTFHQPDEKNDYSYTTLVLEKK